MTAPSSVDDMLAQARAAVRGIDGQAAVLAGLAAWAHQDCRPARTGLLRSRRGPVVHTALCREAREGQAKIAALQAEARAALARLEDLAAEHDRIVSSAGGGS